VTLDQAHLAVTSFLWLAGVVYAIITFPKLLPARKILYIVRMPLALGLAFLYALIAFQYEPPTEPPEPLSYLVRALLAGLAMQYVLTPFVDRLEMNDRTHEIRIVQDDGT
jgi:flagellar biosynthesis protein FliR